MARNVILAVTAILVLLGMAETGAFGAEKVPLPKSRTITIKDAGTTTNLSAVFGPSCMAATISDDYNRASVDWGCVNKTWPECKAGKGDRLMCSVLGLLIAQRDGKLKALP